MEGYTVIPSPRSNDDFVELARTRTTRGRLFRKHILNLGPLVHPKTGETLNLDEGWYSQLRDNFNNGVCDIVQVPLADAQNNHSEDPMRNLGEVVDVQREGNKIFAVMDIRDPDAAGKMGSTLLGTSAFLSMNYKDTKTNKHVGPTLLHTCVTNRPYVTGLDEYAEILSATADGDGEVTVLTSTEAEVPKTKAELDAMFAELTEANYPGLSSPAAPGVDVAALTAALTEAMKPAATVKLTAGPEGSAVSLTDVIGAVAELAQTNSGLASDVIALKRTDAEREIDGYVESGRVLPKQRDTFVDLKLTNPAMLETLLPEKPIVALNHQEGVTPPADSQRKADVDAEVLRLTTEGHTAKYFPAVSK